LFIYFLSPIWGSQGAGVQKKNITEIPQRSDLHSRMFLSFQGNLTVDMGAQ